MKKFDTVFRGYDKYQVQRCLDDIIKNYEALLIKSKKTEEDNKKLIDQIAYYQRIEDTMNRAIYNAENAGDQIKSTARKEAETLISQARHNANRIINDALLKAERAQNHADQLKRNTNILKRRLRQIIENQLEVIDEKTPHRHCLNCGTLNFVKSNNIYTDNDGPFTVCTSCEGSFDIPDELYEILKSEIENEAG